MEENSKKQLILIAMKNIFYLIIILISVLHLSYCVSVKKNQNPKEIEDTSNIIKNNSLIGKDIDKLKIYCGGDSIFFDKKLKMLRSNYTEVYYCLRDKAFQGDTLACRQIATIIPLMRSPFSVYNKKLRGDILLKAVINKLKNFEFIPGPDGDMDNFTYFGSNGSALYEMIDSIDGMSQDDYINKIFTAKENRNWKQKNYFLQDTYKFWQE